MVNAFRLGALAAGALATLYLAAWPVPVEPLAWDAPASAGYTGAHARNTRLSTLVTLSIGEEVGPEHIAVGPDGKLYTTVLSGNILRMDPDGTNPVVFANTGGRVLGFDFDASGNLIAADAYKGLLAISPAGVVSLLTNSVGGESIIYADAVVVAKSGKMYFSDASTRFGPAKWGGTFAASFLDILEQSATGRILEYDPHTRHTRVLVRGLSFANGVTLTADQTQLLVVETGKYRVWKIALTDNDLDLSGGTSIPGAQVLMSNLPGFPDNLMRGRDGRIWLGFTKPRSPLIDALAQWPALRKVTLRLPKVLWPVPKVYGHVIAIDENGKVLQDLQDPSGQYPETTAVTETADRLYVQSLHAPALGWLPASALAETAAK